MKELVILSGKGGTGKTSITASFACLAERPVIADCDVDAADLHLVIPPSIRERHVFMSGHQAVVMEEVCCNCGVCLPECRFGAIMEPAPEAGHDTYWIDSTACEGCGVCLETCPMDVIEFPERRCGEWMISDTACGPMVHARLGVAAENSGKLVTTVRQQARRIAEEAGHPLILVDGPPGIGCPVIASLSGVDMVLLVAEPSLSGISDMERIIKTAGRSLVPITVCVNKHDMSTAHTQAIEKFCTENSIPFVGTIPFDPHVVKAVNSGQSIIDIDCPSGKAVHLVYNTVMSLLSKRETRT